MGRLERMNRGNGIKVRDDKSRGIEILMADASAKICQVILSQTRFVKRAMITLFIKTWCSKKIDRAQAFHVVEKGY